MAIAAVGLANAHGRPPAGEGLVRGAPQKRKPRHKGGFHPEPGGSGAVDQAHSLADCMYRSNWASVKRNHRF